jgi:hypothetical protein
VGAGFLMACDSIRTLSRGGRGPCSCLRGVVGPPPRPEDDGGGWSMLRGGSSGDWLSAAAACVGRRKRGREEFNIRGMLLRSGERERREGGKASEWQWKIAKEGEVNDTILASASREWSVDSARSFPRTGR